MSNADHLSSRAESDLSDVQPPSPIESPSTSIESEVQSPEEDEKDMDSPESGSDEDADGSEDDDYDLAMATAPRPATSHSERSSSTSDHISRKRKQGIDLDDDINNNPELYGLRRSHRSKMSRRVVDSSDEDDDDSSSDVVAPSRRRRKHQTTSKSSKAATPALPATDSESNSDEVYVSARRHILTKKQRYRQMQVANGLVPPSQAEVRFSTRQRARVTNYNEDDEDPFVEEESEMTPSYWAVEDDSPAIDVVLDHRLPEPLTFDGPDLGKRDFEYLIKWQGKAHIHATWETFETLKNLRGIRKLENYYKRKVEEHIFYETTPNVALEDKEKFLMDRELAADALEECKKVERVIGSQQGEEDTEYFVKWKGLNYDSSTWESESLMVGRTQEEIDGFQKQIDEYLTRTQNLPRSDKLANGRGDYRPFKTQPSYIKHGQLREFQIVGVNFLCRNWCLSRNVMLADEMGLGKTVQTVSFLNWLRHAKNQQGPFLIVVPLSTMPAWADTFNNWTPDINYVVYNGNEASRSIIRDHELLLNGDPRKTRFHVLLTTYEYILMDHSFLSSIKWQFLAVDEAHRLKNRNSQLYTTLLDMKVGGRLLITGTPMQNNLEELRALMDFLMPGEIDIDEDIDLNSEAAQQQLTQITADIRPYMLRRTKQLVEKDLPPKTEKIMRVELADIQLNYYKNILTRNYAELNKGNKAQKHSLLNIMMELKKASNHPFMFPAAEERLLNGSTRKEDILRLLVTSSGKMMLLEKLLDKLKKDGHRVLIFSQMVMMLNIMSDYLNLRGYKFQRLDGTMPSSARRQAIDHFNGPDSDDFCFILSTRAGGLGINLMTADTVILFDSDWNPQADLQAMARAHRIGQVRPVTVYRFVSKDTVEEEVLERARNKLMLEYLTIQRGVTENEMKEQLAKKGANFAEPTSSDDISQILKRRGQKMFEQTDNQKKLEALDIDAMLESAEEHKTEQPEGITADGGEEFLKSFEYMDVKVDLEWDDIIPKEQLDAIRKEEEERKNQELIAQLADQEGPRQARRKPANIEEREQRAAKKRAREAAKEAAADVEESDDVTKDPKRPLSEAETRNLLKAYQRWGAFEDMQENIMQSAKLSKRDPTVLRQVIDDVVTESKKAIDEDKKRIEEMEKQANKALTKKDRKEVVFNFRGVKRNNATTMVERPSEMRMIRQVVEQTSDTKGFRIAEAMKPAQDFTCQWGPREDGMLIVGIARYGWGAWVEIRDDPELDMKDKCFLEEQRAEKKVARQKEDDAKANKPTQVHLNRRANYLVSVLKDKLSNGANPAIRKQLENHHRNIKKWAGGNNSSASPAPNGAIRKIARESEKARHRAHSYNESRQRDRTGTPDVRHKSNDHGDSGFKRKDRRDEEMDRDGKRHKYSNGNIHKRRRDEDDHRDRKKQRKSNDMNGSPERDRERERPKSSLKHEDSYSRHRSPDDRKSTSHRPDILRHSSSSRLSEKPKPGRDADPDRAVVKLLEPVSEQIRRIPKLGADKQMSREEKLAKMHKYIFNVGDFIMKQNKAEQRKLWEYFGHKSFSGASAEKSLGMYEKLRDRAKEEAQKNNATPSSNGQSNGVAKSVT